MPGIPSGFFSEKNDLIVFNFDSSASNTVYPEFAVVPQTSSCSSPSFLFTLNGDLSAYFYPGVKVNLQFIGDFTVAAVSFNSGTNQTEVTTVEQIFSAGVNINTYILVNRRWDSIDDSGSTRRINCIARQNNLLNMPYYIEEGINALPCIFSSGTRFYDTSHVILPKDFTVVVIARILQEFPIDPSDIGVVVGGGGSNPGSLRLIDGSVSTANPVFQVHNLNDPRVYVQGQEVPNGEALLPNVDYIFAITANEDNYAGGIAGILAQTLGVNAAQVMVGQIAILGINLNDTMPELLQNLIVAFAEKWGIDLPFTFTIDTTEAGSASDTFVIPIPLDGTINGVFNFGDGTIATVTDPTDSALTHVYATPGIYDISFVGTINGFNFAGAGDCAKIFNIKNWGGIALGGGNAHFQNCVNLNITALDAPDLSSTTDATSMFQNCANLKQLRVTTSGPHGAAWNTSTFLSMNNFMNGCLLFNGDVSDFDVSNVLDFSFCFQNTSAFEGIGLNHWDVTSAISMASMFARLGPGIGSVFNQDLSGWDVSSCASFENMFSRCVTFTGVGLENWNFSSAGSLAAFVAQTAFNIDVTAWAPTFTILTNLGRTFGSCPNFIGTGLDTWGPYLGNITSFNRTFNLNSSLAADLSGWDVSAGTDFFAMFSGCANLPDFDWSGWDMSSASDTSRMFFGMGANFTGQGIGSWNVTSIETMGAMFAQCPNFIEPLSAWLIPNVTDMSIFLQNTPYPIVQYSNFLKALSMQTLQPNVSLDANLCYYNAEAAPYRFDVINNDGWTIVDAGEGAFLLAVTTDASGGVSANDTFVMPVLMSGTYDCEVNYGDPSQPDVWVPQTTGNVAVWQHTYPTAGTYFITIRGQFEGFQFINNGDKGKLYTITQFGDAKLGNTGGYFYGCQNLILDYLTDAPDTTGMTNWENAFKGCSSLTAIKGVSDWDMSGALNLNSTFENCTSLTENGIGDWIVTPDTLITTFSFCTAQNITFGAGWDVSNTQFFAGIFYNNSAFEGNGINLWRFDAAQNLTNAFAFCTVFNPDMSACTLTSTCTTMQATFQECYAFNSDFGVDWDTSGVQFFPFCFMDCKVFNGNVEIWNTSSGVGMQNMFAGAWSFNRPIGGWNMSLVQRTDAMFKESTLPGASAMSFDQDVSAWDLTSMQISTLMFGTTGNPLACMLSTTNYSALINSMGANPFIHLNLIFSGGNSLYNAGAAASHTLLTTATPTGRGWTITDGGLEP